MPIAATRPEAKKGWVCVRGVGGGREAIQKVRRGAGGWVGGCKIPAVVDLFFLTQGPERDQFIRNPVPPRTSRLPAGSSMAFSIWWLQSQDADELRWLYSFGVPRGPSTFSEGTWTLQTCITVSPITF